MDDTTRSIIRNVKGPGTIFSPMPPPCERICPSQPLTLSSPVREDDILCLLESEREARRLR
jgi:ribosomal protein S28E/S33